VTTDSHDGMGAARARLRPAIDVANRLPGRAYEHSASIGIAVFDPAVDGTIDDLIRRADAQMYDEKRTRRQVEATADL